MTDIELFHFTVETIMWLPYVYARKMVMANYEFIEDLLHV